MHIYATRIGGYIVFFIYIRKKNATHTIHQQKKMEYAHHTPTPHLAEIIGMVEGVITVFAVMRRHEEWSNFTKSQQHLLEKVQAMLNEELLLLRKALVAREDTANLGTVVSENTDQVLTHNQMTMEHEALVALEKLTLALNLARADAEAARKSLVHAEADGQLKDLIHAR